MSEETARTHLRSFVERIERLEEEIAGLNGDKRDVFAEAKGCGFDTKALKVVLGIRRKDPSERAEQNAIVALYLSELGMADAAEEVEQNDPRVHVQAHPRTCTREDETPPPEACPASQDEGQAVQVGDASDERSAGTAGTMLTEQSEEFVTATGAGEAVVEPAADPAPASDDAAVSPEGASEERSRTAPREPHAKAPTGGDSRRDGTPSTSRRAAEAAVRARLAPKPLHPGDPLYEIRLAAREGRRLGAPVEVSP